MECELVRPAFREAPAFFIDVPPNLATEGFVQVAGHAFRKTFLAAEFGTELFFIIHHKIWLAFRNSGVVTLC